MKQVTEALMITEFLKGELPSSRFGNNISKALQQLSLSESIITNPDLENDEENILRGKILSIYRGYSTREELFEGFPDTVTWYEKTFNTNDLLTFKYINYSYWIEISNKTRLVKDAVHNIKNGLEVFGQKNDQFLEAAEAVKKGVIFPKIILVAMDEFDTPVILEGHLRATAYALADIPNRPISMLIGFSDKMNQWSCY